MALHGIEIMGHDTHRNKSDPEFGVETIRQHYKFGRVRLPYKRNSLGWTASMKLIDELTTYPKSRTDDCVMAHWFLEWNLPRIYSPTEASGKAWRHRGHRAGSRSKTQVGRRIACYGDDGKGRCPMNGPRCHPSKADT